MPEDSVSRREHEEFARRIDAENNRQNHRIELIEQGLEKTSTLVVSVEKLAANMETMLKEMEKQGQRLSALEGRDGEMWRKVAGYLITATIGLILGAIFSQIGF